MRPEQSESKVAFSDDSYLMEEGKMTSLIIM